MNGDELLRAAAARSWVRFSASKPSKTPKERKPEEVWYDVHKHPEGVPGGMGKSPEYHLRNRGWSPYEINEGSGRKTIQYRNHERPDFHISYGGASSTKPDHNFRVLYIGTNRNIPKVTRAYSVADAMNTVDNLHQMNNGLVVQPMIHDSGYNQSVPHTVNNPPPDKQPRQFLAPHRPKQAPTAAPTMPIGPSKTIKPIKGDNDDYGLGTEPNPDPQLQQIAPAPAPTQKSQFSRKKAAGPRRILNDHGTLAGRNRDKANGEICPLCRGAARVYKKDPDLYRELIDHSGGLTEAHLDPSSEFHGRIMSALEQQPSGLVVPPRKPGGPAEVGRNNYLKEWRARQRLDAQRDAAQVALQSGMHITPEEVGEYTSRGPYPGFRNAISALILAKQSTWEIQKEALGDLTYGPGHPRAGQLMSDEDAHQYLMSGRHQTVKEVAPGITPEEHHQIMGQIPEMDPSGVLEYSLTHPARGTGSNPSIWMRKNQGEPSSWSVGYNDEQGHHGGFLTQRVSLPEALSETEAAGRDMGWL